jgi:3-oxoacyl-[acyl-carrier protein] reductase
MELELAGKRALVTGSSQGIGAGVAEALAQEGVIVAVHGRNADRAAATAERITASGGRAEIVIGDLADEVECNRVAAEAVEKLGGVDILVNNAGGGKNSPANPSWFEVPWSDWIATFEQNVGSTVRLCHTLAPPMKDRGWGRIINFGTAIVGAVIPEIPDYAATKAAVGHVTVSLSRALARTGVTVNTITPGMIRTPVVEQWFSVLGEQNDWGDSFEAVEKMAVGRLFDISTTSIGRVDDIAGVVLLLASEHGSYITGANFRIDGGFTRYPN